MVVVPPLILYHINGRYVYITAFTKKHNKSHTKKPITMFVQRALKLGFPAVYIPFIPVYRYTVEKGRISRYTFGIPVYQKNLISFIPGLIPVFQKCVIPLETDL